MRLSFWCALLALLETQAASAKSSSDKSKSVKPCTIRSPATDRYFDLNPLRRKEPEKGKKQKEEEEGSWHAKGYDYGHNFTINFCGPVVEELDHVQDLDKGLWGNVSAYYEVGSKQYAIGLQNAEPVFRGRKLVLNYTGGSLCTGPSTRALLPHEPEDLAKREIVDGDDDDDDEDEDDKPRKKKPSKDKERRKSTVISLLCDNDPLAKTSIAFVAASEDECTYFFEARTSAACGGIEKETQPLSPGGVFGVIMLIIALVYLVGGCVYQRTVMHQRGWKQLPNYSLWAGIGSFLKDMFIILTSSCARFLPSRRGYSRVSLGHDNVRSRGRHNSDDENRLIDNLDEEWDD